jgi:hypothetical protein
MQLNAVEVQVLTTMRSQLCHSVWTWVRMNINPESLFLVIAHMLKATDMHTLPDDYWPSISKTSSAMPNASIPVIARQRWAYRIASSARRAACAACASQLPVILVMLLLSLLPLSMATDPTCANPLLGKARNNLAAASLPSGLVFFAGGFIEGAQKLYVKEFILSNLENISFLFWRRTNWKFYDHFHPSLIAILNCLKTRSSVFNCSFYSIGPHPPKGNMFVPCRVLDVKKHTHLMMSLQLRSVVDNLSGKTCYEDVRSAELDSVTFTIHFLQNDIYKRKMRWEKKDCRLSVTAGVLSTQYSNLIGAVYSASFSPKASSVNRHLVLCCSASSSYSSLKKSPFTLLASPNCRGVFDNPVDANIFTCSIVLALLFVFDKLLRASTVGQASSLIFRTVISSLPQPLGHSIGSAHSPPCSAANNGVSASSNFLQRVRLCVQTLGCHVKQGIFHAEKTATTILSSSRHRDPSDATRLRSFLLMAIKFHLGHGLKLHSFFPLCLAIISRFSKHLFGIIPRNRLKLAQQRSQRQVTVNAFLLCISISSFCVDGQSSVRMSRTSIILFNAVSALF